MRPVLIFLCFFKDSHLLMRLVFILNCVQDNYLSMRLILIFNYFKGDHLSMRLILNVTTSLDETSFSFMFFQGNLHSTRLFYYKKKYFQCNVFPYKLTIQTKKKITMTLCCKYCKERATFVTCFLHPIFLYVLKNVFSIQFNFKYLI